MLVGADSPRAITDRPPVRSGGAPIARPDPAPDVLGESTTLGLVRLRLFLALVTMFAIPIIIAAPVIYGLAWGFRTSLVVPTLGLLALAGLLGSLTDLAVAPRYWSRPNGSSRRGGSSRTPMTVRALRRSATR